MRSRCPSVATITNSCIKPVTNWRGGTTCILTHLRSPKSFGRRAVPSCIRWQLKPTNNKQIQIHPRQSRVRTQPNYQTNPNDVQTTPWLRTDKFQPTDKTRPKVPVL